MSTNLIGQLCQYKLKDYGKLIATDVCIYNFGEREYVSAATHVFPEIDKKDPCRVDMPTFFKHDWFPHGFYRSDTERAIITIIPTKLVEITKKFNLKGTNKKIYERSVRYYQGLFSHPTSLEPELHWVREEWIELHSGRSYSQDILVKAWEKLKLKQNR